MTQGDSTDRTHKVARTENSITPPQTAESQVATTHLNTEGSPLPLARISVIIPSYNSGAFLREALFSVLDQVPRPHEVVVQDGGSTDDTLEILRSFGERIAWVSAPDGGQSDALNRALARATGDVILWLNADDLLLPGAIAAATAAFALDASLDFAYGDFDMIDGAGRLMRRYASSGYSWERVFARGCYIFSGSLFVRRDLLDAIGGYDQSLHACMDLDLMLRLRAAGRSRHLGMTIARFRMHDTSKSSTIGLAFLREGFQVRRRYAHRSPRLWLIALWATTRTAVVEVMAPLRYSARWPRHGGGKTL
jgi:glycosyltransferase involved in cell wall biosynthesis